MNAEGLDAFEECPHKILDSAVFKHLKEDADFSQKLHELEEERVDFFKELEQRKLKYASIINNWHL